MTTDETKNAWDHADTIVGVQASDPALDQYEWAGWWPVVDPTTLIITGLYDGTCGDDSYPPVRLADIENGRIVRVNDAEGGGGCSDIAILESDLDAIAKATP